MEDIQEDDITEISNPMGLDDDHELNHDQNPGKPIISSIQTKESNNNDFTNDDHNDNDDFVEKYDDDDDDDDLFSLEDPVDTLASESMFINDNTSHQIRNDIIKEENVHIENDGTNEDQQLVRSPILIRDYNNVLPSSSSLLSNKKSNNETISSHQKSPSSMLVNPNKADFHVKSEIMDRGSPASRNKKLGSSPSHIIVSKIMNDDASLKPNDNNHNTNFEFPVAKNEDDDSMTDSMQSLVDGLMTWGEGTQYPSSDDIFHLAGKTTDSDSFKIDL